MAIPILQDLNVRGAVTSAGDITLAATKSLKFADDKIKIGDNTDTPGAYSIQIGEAATATGSHAIAIGYDPEVQGDHAIGIGYAPNNGETAGAQSISVGYMSKATGAQSIAIGYSNEATGSQTVVIGYNGEFSEASTLCTDLDMLARTSDGAILKLQTSDTTVADGDVLGSIQFSAPEEASGTDAILVGAEIVAIAEGTFAADNNATELLFKVGASEAASTALTIASTKAATFAGAVNVTGELNFQKSGFTTISIATNTHTVDFSQQTNNYSISAQNGTNVIAFSNLGTAVVGKSGSIVITNPASVGSLAFSPLPGTAYTPGGGEIAFNTTANKIALINYFIVASDKVLINYVGNFGSYPAP